MLLLDEATSALDARAEARVQAALDDASRGRTTLVVAHRVHAVERCDRVYVLAGGAVVEEGSHAELAEDGRRGNVYRQLYRLDARRGGKKTNRRTQRRKRRRMFFPESTSRARATTTRCDWRRVSRGIGEAPWCVGIQKSARFNGRFFRATRENASFSSRSPFAVLSLERVLLPRLETVDAYPRTAPRRRLGRGDERVRAVIRGDCVNGIRLGVHLDEIARARSSSAAQSPREVSQA